MFVLEVVALCGVSSPNFTTTSRFFPSRILNNHILLSYEFFNFTDQAVY
jgi:hypothetical protein